MKACDNPKCENHVDLSSGAREDEFVKVKGIFPQEEQFRIKRYKLRRNVGFAHLCECCYEAVKLVLS